MWPFKKKTTSCASGLMPLSDSQSTIMAKIIRHLTDHGTITVMDCVRLGTVDGRKVFTELRKRGLLYPLSDPASSCWAPNASGKGLHKVHFWTGVEG